MARYSCEKCNLTFKTINSLAHHLKIDHNLPCERLDGKSRKIGGQYFCCGYQFRNRILWLNHIYAAHGIAVTYERGLTKKVLYLNGVHQASTRIPKRIEEGE